MVGQGSRYWRGRDPAIARALRLNWRLLPKELRNTATNISVMRIGILGFACLVMLSLGQTAMTSTPQQFVTTLFSVKSLFAIIALVVTPLLVTWRAVKVAPMFIDAYARMMPENEDEIRAMFVERGMTDVIAPWIMTRPGRMKTILTRLGNRFLPMS